MTARRFRDATLGLVVLALVVRVGAAAALGGALYFADEADYVDSADRLLAGDGFAPRYDRVPAYPLLLAGVRALAPDGFVAVRALQAALAAAGCALVVTLGVQTFGRSAALAAGLLYALDPMLVVGAGLFYPDAIAAVLLAGILLLVLGAARRDRLPRSAGAGFGLGVLAQLRPVALIVVPVVGVWAALTAPATGGRRVLHSVAVLVGCLVALAPWTVRNYRVRGGLVPIATAGTSAAPVPGDAVRDDGLVSSLAQHAWKEPMGFALHLGREFSHFWELYPQRLTTDNPDRRAQIHDADPRLAAEAVVSPGFRNLVSACSFGPELALTILGSGLAWRTHRRETALLVGVVLSYAVGYALFVGKLRYRIAVLPLLFLLAGHGAVAALRRRHAAVER